MNTITLTVTRLIRLIRDISEYLENLNKMKQKKKINIKYIFFLKQFTKLWLKIAYT